MCKFNSLFKTSKGITAIQVKKTKLDTKDFEQLLFNWILLEVSGETIIKYILLMDSKYNNKDLIFEKSAKTMYEEIVSSNEGAKSLKSKVKKTLGEDFVKFEKAYNKIKIIYCIVLHSEFRIA